MAPLLAALSDPSSMRLLLHAREFGFFGRCEFEGPRGGELSRRARLVAGPVQRLAPFEMQAAPARRVLVRFLELRDGEVGAILRDQRLAPHLQRIGKVRTF